MRRYFEFTSTDRATKLRQARSFFKLMKKQGALNNWQKEPSDDNYWIGDARYVAVDSSGYFDFRFGHWYWSGYKEVTLQDLGRM